MALSTFPDYGISTDEPGHHVYGMRVVRYYLSGGKDHSTEHLFNYHRYAGEGLYDAAVALVERLSPFSRYPTRHLAGAVCGLVGLAGCWTLTTLVAGPVAALWAMGLLALTPAWWGHMFMNAKDIPFATAHVWALVFLCRMLPNPARAPWKTVLAFAVAAGTAMGVRVGGWFLVGYLGGLLALGLVLARGPRVGPAVARWSVAAGLAWGLMLAGWPWAQAAPLARPLAALQDVTRFPHLSQVRFRGRMYDNTRLPWTYVPVTLAVTLPEPYFPAWAFAAAVGWRALRRRGWRAGVTPAALVLAAVLVPVVTVVAGSAVLYNGLRHLTFLLPPLACLAGVGLEAAREAMLKRSRAWILTGAVIAAGWMAWHVGVMVRLHPYEYVFHNLLDGGLPGAQANDELDYWCLSYKEAFEALLARRDPGLPGGGRPWRVYACTDPLRAMAYMPPGVLEPAPDAEHADFAIGVSSPGNDCLPALRGTVVCTVSRFGVPLARVMQLAGGGR